MCTCTDIYTYIYIYTVPTKQMPPTQESTHICKHIGMHHARDGDTQGKIKTERKQYLSHTSDSFACTVHTLLSEQGQNCITPNLSEGHFLYSQPTEIRLFPPSFPGNITELQYYPYSVLGQREF